MLLPWHDREMKQLSTVEAPAELSRLRREDTAAMAAAVQALTQPNNAEVIQKLEHFMAASGPRSTVRIRHGDHLLVRDQLVIGDEENLISYDPNTGKELVRFLGHDGPVRSVSLHPNGMSMASGGVDKSVRVWDTGEGSQSYCFETGRRVTGVAFSPQHQLAMGFGDSQIMISDMREPRK